MEITNNKVVSIDYTLKDNQGNVLDSSQDGEPLGYIHGTGNIIPGLEAALEGHQPGDNVKVTVPPEKGYGVKKDDSLRSFPRQAFTSLPDIEVGSRFVAQLESGQRQMYTVVSMDAEKVVADGNHPLAGMTLNFDVTVREVREATKDELSHGHAHTGSQAHH